MMCRISAFTNYMVLNSLLTLQSYLHCLYIWTLIYCSVCKEKKGLTFHFYYTYLIFQVKIPMPTDCIGIISLSWERLALILKITPRTQNTLCLQLNTHNEEGMRKGCAWQLEMLVWFQLLRT